MAGEIYTTAAIVLSVILTNAYLNARRAKKNAASKTEEHMQPKQEDPLLKMMISQERAEQQLIVDNEASTYIKEHYKYWAHSTVHQPAGSIRYWVCWRGEESPWFADIYYNGKEYTLDSTNGIFYFMADDYAPETIPTELREVLPGIQEQLNEFRVYELPLHPYWNYQTLMKLMQRDDDEHNVYSAINLLSFCWYFRTEREHKEYSHYYDSVLSDHFDDWEKYEYTGHSLYLFVIGWILCISPVLFGSDKETGVWYLLVAHKLEPTNPLYKWAASNLLQLTREETRALAAQVDESQFDGLEPFIKDYFMEMLRGDAQS